MPRKTSPVQPPDPSGPLACAIYARVSTQDQADKGLSIPTQIRECQAHAAREGWYVPTELIFQDAGWSGTRDDRPGLQAMLAAAAGAKGADGQGLRGFDVLLVHASDRLSRDEYFALGVKMTFKNLGILMRSVTEPFFGGSHPMDPLMESVTRAGHAMYIARLVGEIHKGHRAAVAEGRQPGQVPYGYRYRDPDTRGSGWIEHESEGAWVRHIFTRFLQGQTASDIAREMNGAGVPTYTQANRTSPRGRVPSRRPPARGWQVCMIRHLARNRAYLGEIVYRGEWLPGTHAPLVEQEIFERVQILLARRGKGRVEQSERGLFVGGLLRCPHCGSPLLHNAFRWKGYTGAYGAEEYRSNYYCGEGKRRMQRLALGIEDGGTDGEDSSRCPGFSIAQKRALKLLRAYLAARARLRGKPGPGKGQITALPLSSAAPLSSPRAALEQLDRERRRATLRAEMARQERQRQGYFDLVAGGDMRKEEMRAALARLETRRVEVEAEIAALDVPLPPPPEMSADQARDLLAVVDDPERSIRQKRDVLRESMDYLTFTPDKTTALFVPLA